MRNVILMASLVVLAACSTAKEEAPAQADSTAVATDTVVTVVADSTAK